MSTEILREKLSKYPEPFRKALEDCMIIHEASLIDVIEFSLGEIAGINFDTTEYTGSTPLKWSIVYKTHSFAILLII